MTESVANVIPKKTDPWNWSEVCLCGGGLPGYAVDMGSCARYPGRARASVSVSAGKQMAARSWATMAKTLNQAGLARIGQIAGVSPQQLSLFAGKGARQLWEFARGIDDRLVIPEAPAAKSWSSQETFAEDVTNEDWVLAKLRSITDCLFGKVRAEGKTVRTIEVRVRYNDFDDCRRSESLEEPTDLETDCYSVLSRLADLRGLHFLHCRDFLTSSGKRIFGCGKSRSIRLRRLENVHPGEFVLPELGEELGRYTSRKLAERGVEFTPAPR